MRRRETMSEKEFRAELARLSARLDAQERMLAALIAGASVPKGMMMKGGSSDLAGMTAKQHVTLQMLMKGASNADIAARLGISENGAKVHVRLIGRKLGANTRSQIVMSVVDEFREMDPATYEIVSGGLPKDWGDVWMDKDVKDDPYQGVYRSGGGNDEE